MANDNPLMQTDFMKAAPLKQEKPQQQSNENPLMQSDFLTGKPIVPQESPAVDKAMTLSVGRPPAQDMSWSDVGSQALQNAPKSAVEFGKGLIHPFLHPIDTAETLGQLGKGLYSKGKGLLGYERDLPSEGVADAMGQFFKERYGDMPSIKRTLAEDPVGAAADLSTLLTGGGMLAAKAPGLIGTAGQAAKTLGTAIDPVALATKIPSVAAKGVTSAINLPLSIQSGSSYKSLQQAAQAGAKKNPVFWEHLTGSVPATDLINRVNQGISQVAKQRSDEYLKGMSSVASSQPLPYNKVYDAVRAAQNVAYHRGSVVNQQAADTLNKLVSVITDWRNNPQMTHNLEDFDKLKQAIRSVGYEGTYKGSPARKIVDDLANAAKDTIPDKRYVQIMENYQKATHELNDLTKELTTKGGSSVTQIRKILRAQDTKAKGELLKRLEEIDPNLPYAIAGVELNPLIPQGLSGKIASALSSGALGFGAMMNPASLAGLAFTLPRVSGATSYGLSRVGNLPARAVEAMPAAGPAAFQAGRADEVARPLTIRPGRASGGRINPSAMADRIIGQIEKARKELQSETGSLLNHDDETIVRALKVANERI